MLLFLANATLIPHQRVAGGTFFLFRKMPEEKKEKKKYIKIIRPVNHLEIKVKSSRKSVSSPASTHPPRHFSRFSASCPDGPLSCDGLTL